MSVFLFYLFLQQGNDGNIRKFTIFGDKNVKVFPRAHTCFNRIDMPIYKSKVRHACIIVKYVVPLIFIFGCLTLTLSVWHLRLSALLIKNIELFASCDRSIFIILIENTSFLNSSFNFTPYSTSLIFRESARNIWPWLLVWKALVSVLNKVKT